MTDHPRFQQPKGDFERSYHDYYGAPLVSLIMKRRPVPTKTGTRAIQATSLLFVLLGVLAYFVYAFSIGAAPASEMKSPPVGELDTPANADRPSTMPGKLMGSQDLSLP